MSLYEQMTQFFRKNRMTIVHCENREEVDLFLKYFEDEKRISFFTSEGDKQNFLNIYNIYGHDHFRVFNRVLLGTNTHRFYEQTIPFSEMWNIVKFKDIIGCGVTVGKIKIVSCCVLYSEYDPITGKLTVLKEKKTSKILGK